MTNDERIEMLEDAQFDIKKAIRKIEEASNGMNFERAIQYYIIGHLKDWMEGDEDTSIPNLIEKVRQKKEGEDE